MLFAFMLSLPLLGVLWVVMLARGMFRAGRGVRRIRGVFRAGHGLCPSCGYDLRASPGRCPECGATGIPS